MLRPLFRAHLLVAAAVLAALTMLSATPSALAAAETGALGPNEQINPGQRLVTSNGIVLVMQGDGNLVEYASGNRAVWASDTFRAGSILRMQGDGNAVVIAPGNVPVWSTRTSGSFNASLELQTDGNLVVYAQGHVARWANGVRVTTAAPAPAGPTGDVVTLTNKERARVGCAPLTIDSRLTSAAQAHTADMAAKGYLNHTSRDGRTFDRRIRDAGYPNPAAENIASGFTTPSAVMTGWMNSTGHRTNILNCKIKAIGVGYDSRGNYWTQDFGY